MVVLLGAVAGLTTVTLPSTVWLVSTWVMVAVWPTLTDADWFWGTLARAMILEISITVTSGAPGVAISPDLLNWEHLPIAIWPSAERGERAIFSGGAAIAADGRPRILYTSIGQPQQI